MKRFSGVVALALAALAVSGMPVAAQSDELALGNGSKLWLTGTSTLHDYSSTASILKATFACDPARWPAGAAGGEAIEGVIRAKGVTSMDVVVGVTGLKSGKDGLDRNMYKALKAEQQPEIRFRLTGYEVGASSDSAGTVLDAKGVLSIAGVERDIAIAATFQREGDTVRLRASVPLLMTQFGVKPPKMMLGTIRTADQVSVHFDLIIGLGHATQASAGAE